MRGTRLRYRVRQPMVRFIPACAGNTLTGSKPFVMISVHPRVCGEHTRGKFGDATTVGSSPRVRGTRRSQRPHRQPGPVHPRVCGEHAFARPALRIQTRFIPACAGNTFAYVGSGWDWCGSSPRVRGTREFSTLDCETDRFIPACAGNTTTGRPLSCRSTVHPRVCGEHCTVQLLQDLFSGSSPRVRGTLTVLYADTRQERFIPACAGNT